MTARVERVKVDGKRRTVVVYNCPHCGRERKTQLKHLTEWYSTRTHGIPICRKGCVKPEGVKS